MPRPKIYNPRPQTLAARTFELLADGASLTGTEIAQALGVPRNHVQPGLKAPVQRGMILVAKVNGVLQYSRGTPPPIGDDEAPAPKQKRKATPKRKAAKKARTNRKARAAAEPEQPAEDGFQAARWMDGDISLHGCTVQENGCITLSASQATRLLGFLQDQLQ